MKILLRVVINAVALWVAAALLSGIDLGEDGDVGKTILTALVVGAIFGVINTFVKPILTLLSLPFILLTLGLFLIIVNALMLWFLSWLSDQLDLAFHVDDFFWSAIWGALIVSIVSWALSIFVSDD
jgi:putative membrane protein